MCDWLAVFRSELVPMVSYAASVCVDVFQVAGSDERRYSCGRWQRPPRGLGLVVPLTDVVEVTLDGSCGGHGG